MKKSLLKKICRVLLLAALLAIVVFVCIYFDRLTVVYYAGIIIGILGTMVSLITGLLSLTIQIKKIKQEKQVTFSAMVVLTMCMSYTLWFTYALVAPKGFDIFILVANSPGVYNIWRIRFLYKKYEKKPLISESLKELKVLLLAFKKWIWCGCFSHFF